MRSGETVASLCTVFGVNESCGCCLLCVSCSAPAPCRAGAIVVEWRWAQTCWCQAVLAVCSRAVVGRSCRRRNQNGVSRTKVCCLSEQSSGSALCTLFLPNTPSVSWSKHHFVSFPSLRKRGDCVLRVITLCEEFLLGIFYLSKEPLFLFIPPCKYIFIVATP